MPSEQKVNVLLVDDYPENLLALEATLSSLGQNLVTANSGKEALRCLLNQDFAVILLDVQMPGMDGFETATLIREREKSRHTPIIFLTAFSTNESLVFKGYALGAVDYLLKPIEPEILKSKVTVFVDLFRKTEEVKRQAAQLATANTELRRQAATLRKQAQLLDLAHDAILVRDIDGEIVFWNNGAEEMYGWTRAEVMGNNSHQLLHTQFPEPIAKVETELICTGRWEGELVHTKRDGTQIAVASRWALQRDENGEATAILEISSDITNRKQAEEARSRFIHEQVARQEAETANRMKDEFLATLSHELRTPLNSMLGWARLLRTKKFDENTTAKALETIERNAKLQAQLIEDILDVSRIIQGKLQLNLCPVNLKPVIEAAIDTVRPVAEAKAIQLVLELDSSMGLVSGDPDRLQQVVWNLLTNAIKFTPQGGKVEVQLQQMDSYAQIRVRDTGIGISPDFLPHVFERFRQADSTSTRSHGGLGLGLAIVHHLVELHNGKVYVNSEGEGRGATFTVELLLTQCRLETSETEQVKAKPNGAGIILPSIESLQVLVVDDDADTRDVLTAALEQCGAKVTAVSTVSEALKLLKQLSLDILISDLDLPDENGYDLIHQVKALEAERGEKIPVIALSAYTSNEERLKALSAGFQMHLPKPVEPSALIAVVANCTSIPQFPTNKS
ncbi:MAG: response regulator [Chroococcidiopsidaceae cyanobacterium CP_BM_ER_R8_30]|nr:response regulator [Chroococcidiopsidaceae cyanobacterium CP_BM_ER_R8_30]